MQFFKNYFYNKKLKADKVKETQESIGMIHSVQCAVLDADKAEADRCDERHKELIKYLDDNKSEMFLGLGKLREELVELLKTNDEQLTRQIFELKESLDKFLQSQAGMTNIIKKFFKLEIDNATAESLMEKEEPTKDDLRF